MKGRAPIKTGICVLVAGLLAVTGCTNRGIGLLPRKTIRLNGNRVLHGAYEVQRPYKKETYNATLINQATPKTGGPNSPEDDPAYKPD